MEHVLRAQRYLRFPAVPAASDRIPVVSPCTVHGRVVHGSGVFVGLGRGPCGGLGDCACLGRQEHEYFGVGPCTIRLSPSDAPYPAW